MRNEFYPDRGRDSALNCVALAEMMLSLEQKGHGIETVIIEKLDRLSRDLMVQESIIRDFKSHGFNLISVLEGPDLFSADPARKFIRHTFGAIAEYEKNMIVFKFCAVKDRKRAREGKCCIVCLNTKQARKDALDRQAIIESLQEKIRSGTKGMIGNKSYLKFVRMESDGLSIDVKKVEEEAKCDGIWVLRTYTRLSPKNVALALKYKQLWMVERAIRDMKSALDTKPVSHRRVETNPWGK